MKVGDKVRVPQKALIRSNNPEKPEFHSYRNRSVKVAELSNGDVHWLGKDGFIYACPASVVRPIASAPTGTVPHWKAQQNYHRGKAA